MGKRRRGGCGPPPPALRAGRCALVSGAWPLRGAGGREDRAEERGAVWLCVLGTRAGSASGDGIRRMPVSGAVCAQTSPSPCVVSVFYKPSGRLWDLSSRALRNLPTAQRRRGGGEVRACACAAVWSRSRGAEPRGAVYIHARCPPRPCGTSEAAGAWIRGSGSPPPRDSEPLF